MTIWLFTQKERDKKDCSNSCKKNTANKAEVIHTIGLLIRQIMQFRVLLIIKDTCVGHIYAHKQKQP